MSRIKRIRKKIRVVRRKRRSGLSLRSVVLYKEHKVAARELVLRRIAHFNQHYGFAIGAVRIKNQKSRWGSCSKKGNLNFNYRIALLPERLSDYIVVHELCHLGQFNHSRNFWNLVAETMPDYAERREELRKIHAR